MSTNENWLNVKNMVAAFADYHESIIRSGAGDKIIGVCVITQIVNAQASMKDYFDEALADVFKSLNEKLKVNLKFYLEVKWMMMFSKQVGSGYYLERRRLSDSIGVVSYDSIGHHDDIHASAPQMQKALKTEVTYALFDLMFSESSNAMHDGDNSRLYLQAAFDTFINGSKVISEEWHKRAERALQNLIVAIKLKASKPEFTFSGMLEDVSPKSFFLY